MPAGRRGYLRADPGCDAQHPREKHQWALRYLFGPVPATFADENLRPQRQAGVCLAFNADGDADLTVKAADTWDEVRQRLPAGWQPGLLALWLPYTTVPACLWSAPLPRLGLAPDWNLLWHYYRRRLPACDLLFTDTLGGATPEFRR